MLKATNSGDGRDAVASRLSLTTPSELLQEGILLSMMTLEEVRKRIRACEQELYRLYKARVIGIFGSYARGTPREDSDVDILVEFESGASLFDLGGAQAMLSEVLDMPVDVVPREDLRPELRARIEREVVPL